jgi:hypothetical protein
MEWFCRALLEGVGLGIGYSIGQWITKNFWEWIT